MAANQWGVSAIVLWQIAKLSQMGRIAINICARVHIWPLNMEVCKRSTELDFKSDPADELIAATSIVHRASLVTRDRKLRKSRLVPVARP